MYLDVADSSNLPYGWSRYAQFSLGVINQIHNKYSVRKGTSLDMFCTYHPLRIKFCFIKLNSNFIFEPIILGVSF